MSFKDVDDELWGRAHYYMLSQKPATGRPRADLRTTFNGILYVLYTGCRLDEVPKKYGAKSTVHRLHLKLAKEGKYQKILNILLSEGYETGAVDLSLSFIDTRDIPAKKGV